MSTAIIEVQGLSKRYQLGVLGTTTVREQLQEVWRRLVRRDPGPVPETFWALQDVSFQIERGDVVGIMGRNGAGKSTLLKILSRITEPTTGRAVLRGRVSSLLEVGTGFHPDLTGRENVFLNGAILGMKRTEIARQFDEIVAFAEVERFIDTPVKHYSSGMYVRLAFAVAAHLDPDILIVDEVLAVGDVSFQKKCLGKMGAVAKSGNTVLFVSHNPAAIRNLCSRAIVLEAGRVEFSGGVVEGLGVYAANPALATSQAWRREASAPRQEFHFEEITVRLAGRQPALELHCDLLIANTGKGGDGLLAVDICDQSMTAVMQAMPESRPFVKAAPGQHRVTLKIKLPPLIPGIYTVDFWLGRHYNDTVDHVRNAVAFEIDESPSPGRTFPHASDHGFVVPVSNYEYRLPPSAP
jgi:lipopolysaccharide transport system ATP-binding protein